MDPGQHTYLEGKLGGILEGGVVFSSTLCPLCVCSRAHV